jgi:hypothetical protein
MDATIQQDYEEMEMMSDREFWVAIRAAMLAILDAIERKQQIGKHAPKPAMKAKAK